MKTEYVAIMIMIIVAFALLYYGYITLIKNKHLKNEENASSINIDSLIQALGGKDNIQNVESSLSKVTLMLNNQKVIDVDKIQALGATGIVQGKNTVSLIFGKQSALIEQDINKKLR